MKAFWRNWKFMDIIYIYDGKSCPTSMYQKKKKRGKIYQLSEPTKKAGGREF